MWTDFTENALGPPLTTTWRVTARESSKQATPPEGGGRGSQTHWGQAFCPRLPDSKAAKPSLEQWKQNISLVALCKKGRTDEEHTQQRIKRIYTIKTKDPGLLFGISFPNGGRQLKGTVSYGHILLIILIACISCKLLFDSHCLWK